MVATNGDGKGAVIFGRAAMEESGISKSSRHGSSNALCPDPSPGQIQTWTRSWMRGTFSAVA